MIDGVSLTTLSNGLKVVTETIASVRSASIGLWVDVGSRDEEGPIHGATHYLEHLLFKGTTTRNALQLAQVLDEVGGDMNAFTTKEYTAYYARCMDRDVARAVDVLSEMLTASTFPDREVESERDVVLEELNIHFDTPDDLVHSVFADALFGDHPLGKEILGTRESMKAMTRSQVMSWWQSRYTADQIVLAGAGHIDHDEIVALAEEHLAGLAPAGEAFPERARPADGVVATVQVNNRPTEQVNVVIGRQGLPRGHKLRWASAVMNQVLGGGMASRLFQDIREQRGLAYAVYSFSQNFADTGIQGVYLGTNPGKLEEAVDAVGAQLCAMVTDGITADELRQAKGYLTGATLLGLEDTGARMSRLGRSMITGQELLSFDDIIAKIEAVTADDVAEVANMTIAGTQAIGLVGPIDETALGEFQSGLTIGD